MSLTLVSMLDLLRSEISATWNELLIQLTERSVPSTIASRHALLSNPGDARQSIDGEGPTHPARQRGMRAIRTPVYRGNCASPSAGKVVPATPFANRFSYQPVIQSLGWNGDRLAVFRVTSRTTKSHAPKVDLSCAGPLEQGPQAMYQGWDYRQFLEHVVMENGHSRSHPEDSKADRHQCYLSYHTGYQMLESIGADLIECYYDPSPNSVASNLHASLLGLDAQLSALMKLDSARYDQFLAIVQTVSAIPQEKIEWLTNLLAILSAGNWETISYQTNKAYLQALGPETIEALKANDLVDLLSQMDRADLILTLSYLFPLLKMLFCVFGWSKAYPCVIPEWQAARQSPGQAGGGPSGQAARQSPGQAAGQSARQLSGKAIGATDHRSVYQYVSQFETIYPNLAGLMGDTSGPPPNVPIRFSQIHPGFCDLENISEYLWRFNDYGYCCHLREQDQGKIPVVKANQITSKVSYLRSL